MSLFSDFSNFGVHRLTNLYAGAMDLNWSFNEIEEHCPVKSPIHGVDGDK